MSDEFRNDDIQTPENEPAEPVELTIARLEAEADHWKDQAMRAVAEAENTRRRAEREMNDARAYAIQRFARDLLGVADNLERALLAAPTDAADPALKNLALGIEMTEKELLGAFERNGLKRLAPARGEKFDPHLHQAMMEQPSDDVAPGGVIQVLQAGYELFGRIVRPAMVVVAARGAGEPAGDGNPYAKAGVTGGETIDTKA
jgi:molecular chaperone GrpE